MITITGADREFVVALHNERAKFLVVGGRAVQHYAPARQTSDLDLFIGPDGENLATVMAAMGRVDPTYFRRRIEPGTSLRYKQMHVTLRQGHADVLTDLKGVAFDAAWNSRDIQRAEGLDIPVLSLLHLIANKSADNSPKAAADLRMLLTV